MPKRHDNIIHKLFLKSKNTIKAILSSITRIRLIIRIEDPEEALSVNYVYVKEDIKVKKTTRADIITTNHPIKSNITSAINLNTSWVNI